MSGITEDPLPLGGPLSARTYVSWKTPDFDILQNLVALRELRQAHSLVCEIIVDGGVEPDIPGPRCFWSAADILVAGLPLRVSWWEVRDSVPFFIIAERSASGRWELWERSTWEVQWYPISSSRDHAGKPGEGSTSVVSGEPKPGNIGFLLFCCTQAQQQEERTRR